MKTFYDFIEEKSIKLYGLSSNHSNKRLVSSVNPARPYSGLLVPGKVFSKPHGVMGQRKLS